MVLSIYGKQRILSLHWQGCTVSEVVEMLVLEDGIKISKQGVRMFLKRYNQTGTIARKTGSGCCLKLSSAVMHIVEDAMRNDDETTATQLQALLAAKDVYVSLATITRNRHLLGWTYRGSAYCQLIRPINAQKRLAFAQTYLRDSFADVIWSDESTIQLETYKRYCYRKEKEKPRPKPCPKHPLKVHVWAGISKKGPTPIYIII